MVEYDDKVLRGEEIRNKAMISILIQESLFRTEFDSAKFDSDSTLNQESISPTHDISTYMHKYIHMYQGAGMVLRSFALWWILLGKPMQKKSSPLISMAMGSKINMISILMGMAPIHRLPVTPVRRSCMWLTMKTRKIFGKN